MTFHAIFLSRDHSTGRFCSALMPRLPGPRQQGQSAAEATGQASKSDVYRRVIRDMGVEAEFVAGAWGSRASCQSAGEVSRTGLLCRPTELGPGDSDGPVWF